MGGVERQGQVAAVAMATAMAPAAHGIVFAVVTHAPSGAPGVEPCSLREVAAVRVAVALAL